MKLYKITLKEHSDPDGVSYPGDIKFAGSQADARSVRLNFEEPFKPMKPKARPEVTVIELDVPTDKKGLIEFLNELVK